MAFVHLFRWGEALGRNGSEWYRVEVTARYCCVVCFEGNGLDSCYFLVLFLEEYPAAECRREWSCRPEGDLRSLLVVSRLTELLVPEGSDIGCRRTTTYYPLPLVDECTRM